MLQDLVANPCASLHRFLSLLQTSLLMTASVTITVKMFNYWSPENHPYVSPVVTQRIYSSCIGGANFLLPVMCCANRASVSQPEEAESPTVYLPMRLTGLVIVGVMQIHAWFAPQYQDSTSAIGTSAHGEVVDYVANGLYLVQSLLMMVWISDEIVMRAACCRRLPADA